MKLMKHQPELFEPKKTEDRPYLKNIPPEEMVGILSKKTKFQSADSGVIVVDPHMELYAPPGHGKTARNYEELQKAIKERDEAKNVPK